MRLLIVGCFSTPSRATDIVYLDIHDSSLSCSPRILLVAYCSRIGVVDRDLGRYWTLFAAFYCLRLG